MFRALVLEKEGDGPAVAALRMLEESALPEGEVTVAVEYSTLNYKDGLCLSASGGGLVRRYPHVAGIDFAGTVTESADPRYRPGDAVVLTGWRWARPIGAAMPRRRACGPTGSSRWRRG
jgi:acrylyl-CoA reductase (NADPH)